MINIKIYNEIKFNKKEIARYAQIKNSDSTLDSLIDECINEVENKLSYKVCYSFFDIILKNDVLDFGFFNTSSKALIKNLEKCDKAVVFGATIGIEIDRLIAKYGRISPSRAFIFQAIGTERIESLCDKFCDDIKNDLKKENLFTHSRFSPGYGDFSLDNQVKIFDVLALYKNIGLTLNDSLIMSPSKSVTGIVGISKIKKCSYNIPCEGCEKLDCSYKKMGF